MRTIQFLLVFHVMLLGVGCHNEHEFPQEIRDELNLLPKRILTPNGVDPVHWGNQLCSKIASLPDVKERFICQKRWEEELYRLNVDSPDLKERYRQFNAFCDISSSVADCILAIGGGDEAYWESILRRFEWMQNQLARLEPPVPIAPTDHHPRSRYELMRDGYWEFFHDAFDERINDMEEYFNDKTCGRISPQCQQRIRQKIESVLGRKIRTDEEIKEQGRKKRKALCEKLGLRSTGDCPRANRRATSP